MPRPALHRRTLQVRLTPAARAALGPRPSERARELLEQWAASKGGEIFSPVNASTPEGEPAEVEEDLPAKAHPGPEDAERGAMTDPDASPRR
jgi:hypothetical protein